MHGITKESTHGTKMIHTTVRAIAAANAQIEV